MYNAMIDRANQSDNIRFVLRDIRNTWQPTYGLEAKLYLVPDSVPFMDWQCKFLFLDGGVTASNVSEPDDWGGDAIEQRYHRDSVTWGMTIADSVVIDWRPERTQWWSQIYSGGQWCRVPLTEQQRAARSRPFGEIWSDHDKGAGTWGNTNFVVVTGHLANENPAAHADSTILWIDLFYDIGRHETYYDPQEEKQFNATDNLSQHCTTLVVRQRDLAPAGLEGWDKYQSISLPFDATRCNATTAGPLHPSTGVSRRINLRVRYAGNATVALRSIAVRDSIGNLMLTGSQWAIDARDEIQADRDRAAGGPSTIHRSIIGFAADGEQSPIQSASVNQVNKWLINGYDGIADAYNGDRLDTANLWLEGLHREPAHHQLSQDPDSLGRLTMVMPEFGGTQDTREWWKAWMLYSDTSGRGAVHEHNGGRFQLPELLLHKDSIELFERQEQLRHMCQYLPGAPATFLFQKDVAKVAALARDQKKRLIPIVFASSNFWVNMNEIQRTPLLGGIGTDRILEGAELRCMANLCLAYGAKGIFWQVLTERMDILTNAGQSFWYGFKLDWPVAGRSTADALQDLYDTLAINDAEKVERVFLTNVWTGWGVRYRAVRQYNQWLASVGPELMKLTWRDAYSIHAQRPIRYRYEVFDGCASGINTGRVVEDTTTRRTLPSTEIVTKVTARSLDGQLDPDSATYVELGLFDVLPGWQLDGSTWTADVMQDTHHVFLCNRRTFEPSDDIAAGLRRDTMVSLAGTRTIGLKLNIPTPTANEFVFVRVREVAADSTPLPGLTSLRIPLDTIVPFDSVVNLTLGPGRAALLRINYLPWDSTIIAGRLEYSNQRKVVWDPDQRRFHAVYMMAHDSSQYDSVCYRRSRQVTDSTGSILWEPKHYVLSYTGVVDDEIEFNRHPSLTIRRTPLDLTGTAITVVWTGHRNTVLYPARQVLLRTLFSPDMPACVEMDPVVDVVDSAVYGSAANRWGTPVISRTDGSDIIAWSDSLVGIKAAARVLNNPLFSDSWWQSPAFYTDTIHVSARYGSSSSDTRGIYPSVPTFAHIVSRDSNVAVVWEQRYNATGAHILYKRLQHKHSGLQDTLIALDSSVANVSLSYGYHRNPSISQHQDDWRHVQEVVTWETKPTGFLALLGGRQRINVRSIYTATRTFDADDQPDVIEPIPFLWGWGISLHPLNGLDWLYPNVASIRFVDSAVTRTGLSTIAFRSRLTPSSQERVREIGYQWANMGFEDPRRYSHGGWYPTNSETPTTQTDRHIVLYEDQDEAQSPRMKTSREFFFARGRPIGYIARGRELSLRMGDSAGVGFGYTMMDVWMASTSSSSPIDMSLRDTSTRVIDSFATAESLLKTRYFSAGDSTWIGVSVSAGLHGDTTGRWGSHVTYVVELVDSATNQAVHQLDSFRISTTNTEYAAHLVDTLDLLSSTYFVRTRVDTVGVSVPEITNDSRYPIGEVQSEVTDSLPAFKIRRHGVNESVGDVDLRVTTHPNPTRDASQTRFTVPTRDRVRVIVSQRDGAFAATILDEWLEAGRYAVDVDLRGLLPGVYIVQVHVGGNAQITKVVVSP